MEDYRDRNRLWQPDDLQRRLDEARVVIGGMGGLGWALGSALIGLGVRRMAVFDHDTLASVNLNRLWGCRRADIGRAKVEVFAELAREVDRAIDVRPFFQAVPSVEFESEISNADVVFGGFDLPEPRLATQLLALRSQTLYIDVGVSLKQVGDSFSGFGQVFTSDRAETGCIVCAGLRLDSSGYRSPGQAPLPSSGVLNALLANLAVSSWLQSLQGSPLVPLTRLDWDQLSMHRVPAVARRPRCPICGANEPHDVASVAGDAES